MLINWLNSDEGRQVVFSLVLGLAWLALISWSAVWMFRRRTYTSPHFERRCNKAYWTVAGISILGVLFTPVWIWVLGLSPVGLLVVAWYRLWQLELGSRIPAPKPIPDTAEA